MKKKIIFPLLVLLLILCACAEDKSFFKDGALANQETMAADLEAEKRWEELEEFLEMIVQEEIKTQKFYLYGSEPGYEKVPATNLGYLPFYTNEDLGIIEEIVPLSNTLVRPGKTREKTKYIVIHNTGMASPVMTASRLSRSLHNSTRQASWHFTVDDHEIYQQLLLDEIGWHAGSPEGNNYGIGIEMAVYQGIDMNMAMRRTAKLVAWLLLEYGLEIKDVKRHYDFSGKNCPQVLLEAGRWEEFLRLVEIELHGQKNFSDAEFVWETLSPEIMDDEGKILSSAASSVRYRVTISLDGKKRSYEFGSLIKMMI